MTHDVNAGRRNFLGTSLGTGAAAFIAGHHGDANSARPTGNLSTYPVVPIVKIESLTKSVAHEFSYPDIHSPCVLIKLNAATTGGVGPDRNIVAYSSMCTHMGCLVSYDGSTQTFQCPCHFSVFDPENNGQMVCGQATENLPRIELSHDDKTGQLVAIGIQGRLYGRVSNIL